MSRAANKLISAAAGAGVDTGDDDFANVVLLLDGDGTSGDDNNTFTDSSTNGFTVTENGSVVQGSFSPYGDNWSFYFDSGEYIYTPSTGQFVCGTSTDFTIELWYCSAPGYSPIQFDVLFSQWPAGSPNVGKWFVGIEDSGGAATFYNRSFSFSTGLLNGTTDITDGNWHHIAVTRTGSVFRLFVDGTQEDTATRTSDSVGMTASIYFNTYEAAVSAGNDNYGEGWISNARLIQGTSLYTADFTAPTSPLTAVTNTKFLSAQSNRFIENSSNNFSFTINGTPKVTPFSPFKNDDARTLTTDGGSGYFDDSSNSYLQIADNSVFDATTSLCIEAWFYMTSSPGSGPDAHAVVSKWVSTTPGQRTIFIDIENTGLRVYADLQGASNPVLITTDGGAISQHEWHHVAVTWDGSTYRAFLDGALEGSTSSSSAPIASSQVVKVGYNTNTHYFGGYITDVRWITDGGAIYTSGFTPPTSPLTAITNTELLLNFQDAGIYDRTGINNINTVGNAQIDTAVKKYGTGSIQFDGTDDYIEASYVSDLFDFGSEDWTMECWVYLQTDSDSAGGIIEIYKDDNNYIRLFRASGADIQLRGVSGGTTQFDIQSSSQSLDTWIHVAGVRDGSTIRLFVDGTQIGTDTSFSIPDLSDARVVVGLDLPGTDRYFTGYIDDLRITKGVARYTSNFTPPDQALPKF